MIDYSENESRIEAVFKQMLLSGFLRERVQIAVCTLTSDADKE